MRPSRKVIVHAAVALACAAPLVFELWAARDQGVAAEDQLMVRTGDWALNLLVASLAVSPAAQLLRRPQWLRERRIIGLAAFGYAALHVALYVFADEAWSELSRVLVQPYLLLGAVAFLLMVPMAATSTNAMTRAVGPAAWRRIHQALYLIAPLVLVHYLLPRGMRTTIPIYAAVVAALLGWRVFAWFRARRAISA